MGPVAIPCDYENIFKGKIDKNILQFDFFHFVLSFLE